ncbi:MAG: beta-lactamase family protein [Kofleriaceae bacterium]|nr:beta-lactamase family protein [Kofleriaceae bacterium]
MAFMLRRYFETLVRTAPVAEVTRTATEDDPRSVGLEPGVVADIWSAAAQTYMAGLYPAMALCVRRRGKVIIDRAIGHARGNAPHDPLNAPRVQATPATLFNLFSASKMVTAMLVHLCSQRGLLHFDDRVVDYLPEFGQHGKHRMTIRHVLTHRAGIPHIPREFADLSLIEHPDQILQILAAQKPLWRPGRRLAYHALTGGYVLAPIVERLLGKPIRQVLHDEILAPLGFATFNYGIAPERVGEVAVNAFTGPAVLPGVSNLMRRALSVDFNEAVRISNDPRYLTGVVPAGNIIGTANEASRFMQLLLNGGELDGVRIFEPKTITRATMESSYHEIDLTMGAPVNYSMGFMLGARLASVYGLGTQQAFGHMGFTNIFVYADPSRDLAVALMTSGKPAFSIGLARTLMLMQTIARRVPRDGRGPLLR